MHTICTVIDANRLHDNYLIGRANSIRSQENIQNPILNDQIETSRMYSHSQDL